MKILVVGGLPKEKGGSYSSGVTNVINELINYQNRYDEIILFVTNMSDKKVKKTGLRNYKENLEIYGYKFPIVDLLLSLIKPKKLISEILSYKNSIKRPFLRFLFYSLNFKRIIENIKPELIHLHGVTFVFPIMFANPKKIPSLVTFHGIFYKGTINTEKFKELYLNSSKEITNSTFLTKEMKTEAENFLLLKKQNNCIIPNGINKEKFVFSQSEREKIRIWNNVGEDDLVLITVASLQHRKGQYKMIKFLEKNNFKGQYWMIGRGPDYNKISEFIKTHALEKKYKLVGYVPNNEVYKYYSASDLYVHCSEAEGQALSAIEAANTGLQLLVRDDLVGTLGEYDKNIIIFNINEYINLSELNLIPRKEVINSNTIFSWEDVAIRYHNFYKKIY